MRVLARARAQTSRPAVLARATRCFAVLWPALRVRALLDHLRLIGGLRVRPRATGSFCVTVLPTRLI